MLTVKIISGTYGYNTGKHIEPKDRKSEPFMLSEDEANRIVALGIAEIVSKEVATGGNGEENNSAGVNPNNDENGSKVENEGEKKNAGHLDEGQLKEMTNKDLKSLAEDMGVDTSKMKVKNDYIQAILDVEVSVPNNDENGENPPDLSAEAPVI